MPTGSFYVYALLDPRTTPPKPFYIGKGNGPRAYAHLSEEGQGRKILRIREIRAAAPRRSSSSSSATCQSLMHFGSRRS